MTKVCSFRPVSQALRHTLSSYSPGVPTILGSPTSLSIRQRVPRVTDRGALRTATRAAPSVRRQTTPGILVVQDGCWFERQATVGSQAMTYERGLKRDSLLVQTYY